MSNSFAVGQAVRFARRTRTRKDEYSSPKDRLGRPMKTVRRAHFEAIETLEGEVERVGPLLVYVRVGKNRVFAMWPDQLKAV